MAQRQPYTAARGVRADQRIAILRGGAQAAPAADDIQRRQRRHKMAGAVEHLPQQGEIQLALAIIELARRANQQLASGPRLQVKRYRGTAAVGAGAVAQLNQLVMHPRPVAIGNCQLTLPGPQPVFRQQRIGLGPQATTMARACSRLPLASSTSGSVIACALSCRQVRWSPASAISQRATFGA